LFELIDVDSAVCSVGYRAATVDDACSPCPTKRASWGYTAGFTVLLLLGLAVLYWAMAREQPSSAYIAARRDLRALSIAALTEGRKSMTVNPLSRYNNMNGSTSGGSEPGTPTHGSPSQGPILNQSVDNTLQQLESVDNEYNPSMVMTRERRIRPNFTYSLKIALGFFQVASTLTSNNEVTCFIVIALFSCSCLLLAYPIDPMAFSFLVVHSSILIHQFRLCAGNNNLSSPFAFESVMLTMVS
jgi:hypothetical protein